MTFMNAANSLKASSISVLLISFLGCAHSDAPISSASRPASQDGTADTALRQTASSGEASPASSPQRVASEATRCTPDQPFPYPKGAPYVGLHANRENNNRVYCAGAPRYELAWEGKPALEKLMIFQPISLSPDGSLIYAAASRTEGCKLFAVRADTGEVAWCKGEERSPERLTIGVSGGTPEVDMDGNIYVTDGMVDPKDTAVFSWTQGGVLRWKTPLGHIPTVIRPSYNAPSGVHFTPDGYVAGVLPSGLVFLLERATGEVLTSFDIPGKTGYVGARPKDGVTFAWMPRGLKEKLSESIGDLSPTELVAVTAASKGASGSYSDNTIGISAKNQLFIVGGGPNPDDGALICLDVTKKDGRPELVLRWSMIIKAGSATSPAISRSGHRVVVGDGASGLVYGDVDKCNANTDADPKPEVCASAWVYPIIGKSLLGSPAIDEDGVVYAWDASREPMDPDVFAIRDVDGKPDLLWVVSLAKDDGPNVQWTSIATVLDNQLVGTATTVVRALKTDKAPLMLELYHEMVGLDRRTGELLWRQPATDDSINSPAVGPDGSLYVPMLGVMDLTSPSKDVVFQGGIVKYRPVYP